MFEYLSTYKLHMLTVNLCLKDDFEQKLSIVLRWLRSLGMALNVL